MKEVSHKKVQKVRKFQNDPHYLSVKRNLNHPLGLTLSTPSLVFLIFTEIAKNVLIDNEDLVKASYYGFMKQAQQAGLLDKAGRIYFVGEGFTINLIPQALLVAGWLGCKVYRIFKVKDFLMCFK